MSELKRFRLLSDDGEETGVKGMTARAMVVYLAHHLSPEEIGKLCRDDLPTIQRNKTRQRPLSHDPEDCHAR
jgi:hypothetical protein